MHSPQFKFKVALEALKGEQSINEIAAANKVAPAQVSSWKADLLEQGSQLFVRKNGAQRDHSLDDAQQKLEAAERKVGQLSIERDWLVKKCEELGL